MGSGGACLYSQHPGGRDRHTDLCVSEASLVYKASSRTGSKAIVKLYLKKQNGNNKKTSQKKKKCIWVW